MNKIITISIVCAVLFGFSSCSTVISSNFNEEDRNGIRLAKCLTDSGAQFFGAYTCSHCIKQKKLFGSSADDFLPYVECNPQAPNSNAQLCVEKNIESLPTWILKDGTRLTGYQALETLQQQTGCTDDTLANYSFE